MTSDAVPSTLFVPGDGTIVVGDAAELRARLEPERVLRGFRRRVGDPTPIHVAGEVRTAEALLAFLTRWVVGRVEGLEGGPPDRIAVSVPTSWGPYCTDLVRRAMVEVGLDVTLVAEPLAAAVQLAPASTATTVAVYDLGGGTFDAAVVRCAGSTADPAGVGLLGPPEGIDSIGGGDFDDLVLDHVRRSVPDAFAAVDEQDAAAPAAMAKLRAACREAKETLSVDTEVAIPVLLPGVSTSVRLHRAEFEALIRPHIEDTVGALHRAIASAGVVPSDLGDVLLVGGSSRIPLVAEMVSARLGRPATVLTDPENAIACGAALALAAPRSTLPRPVGPEEAPAPTGPGDEHTQPLTGQGARPDNVHARVPAFPVRPPKRKPDLWIAPRPPRSTALQFAARTALLTVVFAAVLIGGLMMWQIFDPDRSTIVADTGRPPREAILPDPTTAVPLPEAVPPDPVEVTDTTSSRPVPTRGESGGRQTAPASTTAPRSTISAPAAEPEVLPETAVAEPSVNDDESMAVDREGGEGDLDGSDPVQDPAAGESAETADEVGVSGSTEVSTPASGP